MMFLVAVAAPLIGLALMYVLARLTPVAPCARASHPPVGKGELREIAPETLRDVLADLAARMGMAVVFSAVAPCGRIDVTARDPRPVAGGRLQVRATAAVGCRVGAAAVRAFAEALRDDAGTLKGIYVALGGFSEDARDAACASSTPIVLVDAARLVALLEAYAPERAAELRRCPAVAATA